MASIIELNDIRKVYGGVIVGVDHVSMSVEDGEFVTLLGPSGCGKSTLLRMIGGFEQPTAGQIVLAGRDVTYEPPHKRDVNMVFQDYALFPHMTVGENISYGLRMMGLPRSETRSKAVEALDLVGLPEKIDQKPHELSGGQRQRIALARAIVRNPKVLLLDEPLSALDANLREQMQVELKHMHEKVGITFIMVTHDQTEALVMSDRVIVMEKGRVAQDGTPAELYDHPETPYVANFIGTTNFLPARVLSRDGGSVVVEAGGTRIIAEVGGALPEGEHIRIGIRPEKLHFAESGASGPGNTLEGRIEEQIYYGLGMRTVVRLAEGSTVLVDGLLPEAVARTTLPEIGSNVRLSIAPHNVRVFAAEN
ncbi:ABC transporter ATP-binding protein [Oricola nitratireducens]|uniref:ABC transporter ATP-binding protein n=1 Tax=Oricola nitratireducens TaxID=2775868 RepID=UPI0018689C30|nr:ABC transporter ATP-binding protein [Oricola nitratireducens]